MYEFRIDLGAGRWLLVEIEDLSLEIMAWTGTQGLGLSVYTGGDVDDRWDEFLYCCWWAWLYAAVEIVSCHRGRCQAHREQGQSWGKHPTAHRTPERRNGGPSLAIMWIQKMYRSIKLHKKLSKFLGISIYNDRNLQIHHLVCPSFFMSQLGQKWGPYSLFQQHVGRLKQPNSKWLFCCNVSQQDN